MFSKDIRIQGKHALIVKKYSQDKQAQEKVPFVLNNHEGRNEEKYVFETMIDCIMVATMLGIINKRTAEEDVDKNISPATIFTEIILKRRNLLERIYYHLEFSNANEENINEVIKKAFVMSDEEKKIGLEKFKSYMRGGLEIIDEQFKDVASYEDLCNAFIELKQTYQLGE